MLMVAGLNKVASGKILVNGQLINNLEPKEHDTAGEFPSCAIYPNMNVVGVSASAKMCSVNLANQKEKLVRSLLKQKFGSFCEAVRRNH